MDYVHRALDAQAWTELVSNVTNLAPAAIDDDPRSWMGWGDAGQERLSVFLHEATHHRCFTSKVAFAMAGLSLHARQAVHRECRWQRQLLPKWERRAEQSPRMHEGTVGRVVTSPMHNLMTRSAIAVAAAVLACGCGDDNSVSVEIESVQATPSALGIGQTAKLQWSIDPRAHLDLLHWVTLFPGHVEKPAPDVPDGIAAVGQTQGTFLCTYSVGNELVCVDEMDPHDGGLVIAIGEDGMHRQELTLRACILGMDGNGDKHGSCEYESITLTLTTL